jgi:hypothetical protein
MHEPKRVAESLHFSSCVCGDICVTHNSLFRQHTFWGLGIQVFSLHFQYQFYVVPRRFFEKMLFTFSNTFRPLLESMVTTTINTKPSTYFWINDLITISNTCDDEISVYEA